MRQRAVEKLIYAAQEENEQWEVKVVHDKIHRTPILKINLRLFSLWSITKWLHAFDFDKVIPIVILFLVNSSFLSTGVDRIFLQCAQNSDLWKSIDFL
jgi:hypothetical protein